MLARAGVSELEHARLRSRTTAKSWPNGGTADVRWTTWSAPRRRLQGTLPPAVPPPGARAGDSSPSSPPAPFLGDGFANEECGLTTGGGFCVGGIFGLFVCAVVHFVWVRFKERAARKRAGGVTIEAVGLDTAAAVSSTSATSSSAAGGLVTPPPPPPLPERAALPPEWTTVNDAASGRAYYYNTRTGHTQWTRPK